MGNPRRDQYTDLEYGVVPHFSRDSISANECDGLSKRMYLLTSTTLDFSSPSIKRHSTPRRPLFLFCRHKIDKMIPSTRPAAALLLRGMFIASYKLPPTVLELICHPLTAKPTSSLIPYRSIAAISSSATKSATAVLPQSAQGSAGTPPMSVTGKVRREVPLPSQEGKKGVMQYALYVVSSFASESFGLQTRFVPRERRCNVTDLPVTGQPSTK